MKRTTTDSPHILAYLEQYTQSGASVKKMKKTTPGIFSEWQDLKNAEAAYAFAKQELKEAQRAWKDL